MNPRYQKLKPKPRKIRYNFVQPNEEVLFSPCFACEKQPDECRCKDEKGKSHFARPNHSQWHKDRLTGWIDYTVTTETPLYIRAPGGQWDPDFYHHPGAIPKDWAQQEPVLPGSSIRGMIRSLVEILSFSKISFVSSPLKFKLRLPDKNDPDFHRDSHPILYQRDDIPEKAKNIPKKDVTPDPDPLAHLSPLHKSAKIDFAQGLFGWVQDKSKTPLKGRLTFEDCVMNPIENPFYSDQAVKPPNVDPRFSLVGLRVPRVLSGAKTKAYMAYLQQSKEVPTAKKPAVIWGSKGALIRGSKVYWPQIYRDSWMPNELKEKKIEDFTEGEKAMRNGTDPKPKDKQHTLIRPVREGVSFKGRIRFENLSQMELGALLTALRLQAGMRHRLGMGKPLGMGQIEVGIVSVHILDFNSNNPTLRSAMKSLDSTHQEEIIGHFEEAILELNSSKGAKGSEPWKEASPESLSSLKTKVDNTEELGYQEIQALFERRGELKVVVNTIAFDKKRAIQLIKRALRDHAMKVEFTEARTEGSAKVSGGYWSLPRIRDLFLISGGAGTPTNGVWDLPKHGGKRWNKLETPEEVLSKGNK